MTTSNYYGITGLGSNVKFGKTGGQISYDLGDQSFTLKQPDTSLYAGLSVRSLDVITGDINLITGKISFNGTTLEWQQSGVLRVGGSTALMIPSGNDAARPLTGLVGMIRINTQATIAIEYFDGTTWRVAGGNALQLTGGTMTGNIAMSGGATVTGLPAPILDSDAATKLYVDNLVQGLSWKQAVAVLTNANINVNGPSSASIGGATVTSGERVLLTNQIDNSQNGIWVFNGVGVPMTRALDSNIPGELNGAAVFVMRGTYGDQGWTQTATLTNNFGGQVWVQFTSGTAYSAGTGLSLVGNQFNVRVGNGLTVVDNDITVNTEFGNAIQLNETGQVILKLDADSGLLQSADGLKIGAGSVTNDMLAGQIETSKLLSNFITFSDGTTTDNTTLGGVLTIAGSGAISTTLTSGVLSVAVASATTTTQGVASFNSTNFNVTNGSVSVNIIDAGLF